MEDTIMRVTHRKKKTIPLAILMIFLSVLFISAQEIEELKIFQTDRKITVDGDLDDWTGISGLPVNISPGGETIEPSPGMAITARFTYDVEKFYAAVEAEDDFFAFPSRSWRHGDGLYLTFLDPCEGNSSDRFKTFGLSLEGKKKIKLLVNKDGDFFPGVRVGDIELEIIADEQQKTLTYEIAIPWKYILPFQPFFQEQWGINLIYVDRDLGKKKIVLLYPDTGFDTELTNTRKGAIFQFVNHTPKKVEIQSALAASHYYHDAEKTLSIAMNAPAEKSGWTIRYELSSAQENVSRVKKITLQEKMNVFRLNLEEKDYPTGSYDLSVGILDDKGSLRFTNNHRFFIVNRVELESFIARIEEIKNGELYAKDERFRISLPTLEARMDWIQDYMKNSPPFSETNLLVEWYEEIDILFKNIEIGKPALFPPGSIGRLVHISEIDETFQPYSAYIPEGYDDKEAIPLFVTLHGSGVDERNMILQMSRTHLRARFRKKFPEMIVIAPKARGLSDWYTGDSGKEVIECIDHIKSLYNIDETNIILDGFSMGGYGAWRLSLLNPQLFKAVIIRSGAIETPSYIEGENILDLLDRGKGLNFFIVHGDRDNSLPVKNSRQAVQKLVELGINHEYIEVKGASHIGYNKWNEIFDWLKKIISR
jgi:predicted esterase